LGGVGNSYPTMVRIGRDGGKMEGKDLE